MEKPELISPTAGVREMTALMSHAWGCYPGGVRRELQRGADPDEQDQSGYTALMWLCRMYDRHFRERKRIFRSLIAYGASVELLDKRGDSLLVHAADGPERRFRRFVRSQVKRIRKSRRVV